MHSTKRQDNGMECKEEAGGWRLHSWANDLRCEPLIRALKVMSGFRFLTMRVPVDLLIHGDHDNDTWA